MSKYKYDCNGDWAQQWTQFDCWRAFHGANSSIATINKPMSFGIQKYCLRKLTNRQSESEKSQNNLIMRQSSKLVSSGNVFMGMLYMMIEYLQESVFAMFSSLADQKGFPSIIRKDWWSKNIIKILRWQIWSPASEKWPKSSFMNQEYDNNWWSWSSSWDKYIIREGFPTRLLLFQ